MKKLTTEKKGRADAQLQTVIEHYENARMDGLCHEGAWEIAVSRTKDLNIPSAVLDWLEAQLRG